MNKLPLSFYNRTDVVLIARELLGKIVVTHIHGQVTSGRIVETEAYVAITDRASHSFGGRRTPKNEHMYWGPGTVYVYIAYGLHRMLNVVTNKKEIPDAVLIRAIEPVNGIEIMMERRGKSAADPTITRGPGNTAKALGITDKTLSGLSLTGESIFLYDDGRKYKNGEIGNSVRIGIDGAGADALLPYRFYIKKNRFVSGRRN